MVELKSVGGQEWDGIVSSALHSSGVDGTVMLGGGAHRISIPFGLQALMKALLNVLAPDAPARLRVYTYDVLDIGSHLEVRGARVLTTLPAQLLSLAEDLGVKLNLHRVGTSSTLLLTLPSQSSRN